MTTERQFTDRMLMNLTDDEVVRLAPPDFDRWDALQKRRIKRMVQILVAVAWLHGLTIGWWLL